MDVANENSPAAMGDNNPPSPVEEIRFRLCDEFADLAERGKELEAAAGRVPEVEDDETAGKVSDFIKQVSACLKRAEADRKAEKEPYRQAADSGCTDPGRRARAAHGRRDPQAIHDGRWPAATGAYAGGTVCM